MSLIYNSISSIFRTMPRYYYAVAIGRRPGIYNSWDECKQQIHQYPAAAFKKFTSQLEANNFIAQCKNSSEQSTSGIKFASNSCGSQTRNRTIPRKIPQESLVLNRSASTCFDDGSSLLPPSKKRKVKVSSDNNTTCDNKTKLENFSVDENGYVKVYTDGACSSNGGKNARAGIGVWFGHEHPLNISRAVDGRATNNMAEIQAVTVAANQAKNAGIKKLRIITDSQFLIKCQTEWMPNWKRNGWKTAANKPVINKVELLEMEAALASLDIVWDHVRGHIGIEGNEMADKLARAGCLEY